MPAIAAGVVVENNSLGGNEDTQAKFLQEHGKDALFYADDPSLGRFQHGEAINKAMALVLGAGNSFQY
ncbi:hypothetical protein GJV04_20920 [Enterobacteriaceae bacterium RIT714]|nr:hypothetical protein [Enterobacteriaceae bacterium RIT714]